MRLVMFGFALQSITDNTLIAATASVLFAWVSTIFARGAIEAAEGVQEDTQPSEDGSILELPRRRPSLPAH